jgi:hypothetical protein
LARNAAVIHPTSRTHRRASESKTLTPLVYAMRRASLAELNPDDRLGMAGSKGIPDTPD